MATFALYTYKFRHVDNIGVFVGQEQETTVALDTLEERQNFLQAIFRDDLNQQRKFNCFRTEERKNKETGKKEKNSVGFDCKTLWEHNGFIILMVSNKKRITRHQRFQKFKDQDEPWCHVVIDNRYGQEFIAIEKNGAFAGITAGSSFAITIDAEKDNLTIRAANGRGGFGEAKQVEGTATGIHAVKAAIERGEKVIYNLAGQRVDAAYKGLVIRDGVKIMQK